MLTSIIIKLSGTKLLLKGECNEICQTLTDDTYETNNAVF